MALSESAVSELLDALRDITGERADGPDPASSSGHAMFHEITCPFGVLPLDRRFADERGVRVPGV